MYNKAKEEVNKRLVKKTETSKKVLEEKIKPVTKTINTAKELDKKYKIVERGMSAAGIDEAYDINKASQSVALNAVSDNIVSDQQRDEDVGRAAWATCDIVAQKISLGYSKRAEAIFVNTDRVYGVTTTKSVCEGIKDFLVYDYDYYTSYYLEEPETY